MSLSVFLKMLRGCFFYLRYVYVKEKYLTNDNN